MLTTLTRAALALASALMAFNTHAATPEEIAGMDAAALHKLDATELCIAYHALKPANVRDELTRRHGFTRRVWWQISRDFPDALQVMTYPHVVCMWGTPAKEKRDVAASGIKRTLTYNMEGRVFRVVLLNEVVQSYTESEE